MNMPKDEIQKELANAWGIYLAALGKSLTLLEKSIKEASSMANECTSEWCKATEHVIDDISNALFSISEPRWLDKEQSKKLKRLKHKVHDLYADYRGVYRKVS